MSTHFELVGKGVQMSQREVSAEYLGVAEAEAMTNVSRWTWRRWAYDGKVSSVKLGKRLLIPASEISRLVAENMRPRLSKVR
jgi:excisionase family DNA binding protein